MEWPTASIVITHWNRPHHLTNLVRHTLQGINKLDQNDVKIIAELIIIDSASANSEEIQQQLLSIIQQSGRKLPIKAIYLQQNQGPSYARLQGLHIATGDYIQFLDDDDWIAPEKLPIQLRWAACHPNADVIASTWAKVPATAQIGEESAAELQHPDFRSPQALSVLETFTPLMACLLKRSTLLAAKAFEEGHWLVEDVHLQLKLINQQANFSIAPSPEPLFFYRASPPSHSLSTAADRVPFLEACLRNLELAEQILGPEQTLQHAERSRLARLYGQVARGLYASDRLRFKHTTQKINHLDPHYIPTGPPALRVASKLLGYPRAEQLSHWLRRLKQQRLRRG